MRTLIRVLLGALAVSLLTLTAPSQAAGSLIVTHTPLSTTTSPGATCANIPITWTVTVPTEDDWWAIDGTIINAAGASVDDVFEYELVPVTTAYDTINICGLTPGTFMFRLYATAEAYDDDYPYGSQKVTIDETFTVTVPAYTPPPPVTYTASADFEKNVWFKKEKVARLGASLDITYNCSGCSQPERPLKIQALRNGNWTTIATRNGFQYSAYLKVPVPYKFQKVRVKMPSLKTDAYTTFAAVKSNTIKVPDKPKN